ncbi:hypothetical protein [Paenibacillus turpanensis]|uniref:hypothetical protein n=1 Tax=Paenibacillus turpanensis TaxID=2689078 RepID=UPI00140D2220|nr:hypothetical protein [Paenibacillus turpanensis]
MYKWIMSLLLLVGAMYGLLVTFNQLPKAPSKEELAAEANRVKIVATNWKFDKPVYEVAKGSKMEVVLENKTGVHGIEIKGLDVLLDGNTLSKEVTFDKEGEYEIVCIVLCGTGHLEMKSTLVVK